MVSEDESLNIMVGSMAGGRHGTGTVSKSLLLSTSMRLREN